MSHDERRFMDYVEADGTTSRLRWKFAFTVAIATFALGLLVAIPLQLSPQSALVLALAGSATTVAGVFIAFFIDWREDKKKAKKG